VTLAASAVIAFILTNLLVGWIKGADIMHGACIFERQMGKGILMVALGA
jgi:hypothetical protein